MALERAAGYAAAAGDEIARRITWQQQDLRSWDPGPQRFDLVSAQFMHLSGAELEAMHGRLAACRPAVRPGGTLLVVSHHPDDMPAKAALTTRPDMFRSAEHLAASLDPGEWEIRVASAIGRSAIDPDGQPVTILDTVLRAARRP